MHNQMISVRQTRSMTTRFFNHRPAPATSDDGLFHGKRLVSEDLHSRPYRYRAANLQGLRNHWQSFDHLRSVRESFTAIANALRCPTRTTSFRARVIPV